MTFREFVEYINVIPTECLEDHLRNQTYGRGHLVFDYIVRLEHLQSDITQLSQALCLTKVFSSPRRNKTAYCSQNQECICDKKPDQFSNLPIYTYFYDKQIIDLVAKKYADDIKVAGYSFLD